jgi:hypothetical protein
MVLRTLHAVEPPQCKGPCVSRRIQRREPCAFAPRALARGSVRGTCVGEGRGEALCISTLIALKAETLLPILEPSLFAP